MQNGADQIMAQAFAVVTVRALSHSKHRHSKHRHDPNFLVRFPGADLGSSLTLIFWCVVLGYACLEILPQFFGAFSWGMPAWNSCPNSLAHCPAADLA